MTIRRMRPHQRTHRDICVHVKGCFDATVSRMGEEEEGGCGKVYYLVRVPWLHRDASERNTVSFVTLHFFSLRSCSAHKL